MSESSDKVKRWRKKTKERMVSSMGGKCQCCGYDKCIDVYEFHHINPYEKSFSLSDIKANPASLRKIADELEKCILVCSNCHKEIHSGMDIIPEKYHKFDKIEFLTNSESDRLNNVKTKMYLSDHELYDMLCDKFEGNLMRMVDIMKFSKSTVYKNLRNLKKSGKSFHKLDELRKHNTIKDIIVDKIFGEYKFEPIRKIDLTNKEVYDTLMSDFGNNKSKMAKHYGVSETTIRKRVNKYIKSLS